MVSACTACPPGWYQGNTGATLCSICIAGTYQPSYAGQNVSSCLACPVGSISSGQAGQTSCLICPAGNYCPYQGQTVSVTCPVGYPRFIFLNPSPNNPSSSSSYFLWKEPMRMTGSKTDVILVVFFVVFTGLIASKP
jgi:hypothetical protein